jgi:hypothetical protein
VKPILSPSLLVREAAEAGVSCWAVITKRVGWPSTVELYTTEKIACGIKRKREEQGHIAEVVEYTADECKQAAARYHGWA